MFDNASIMATIMIIIEFQEFRDRLEKPFNFQLAKKLVLKPGLLQSFQEHIGDVSRFSTENCCG